MHLPKVVVEIKIKAMVTRSEIQTSLLFDLKSQAYWKMDNAKHAVPNGGMKRKPQGFRNAKSHGDAITHPNESCLKLVTDSDRLIVNGPGATIKSTR